MAESPFQLYADPLTSSDQRDLVDFDCGSSPWARAATEWIRGTDVWDSINNRKTRVWLYRNESGIVVGYGALGITRRKWPPPDGRHENIQIIPMLGLDHRFHGMPKDRNWRYSHQIISHLRYEAHRTFLEHVSSSRSTLPLLILYVHHNNSAAIKLYQNFGFVAASDVPVNEHLLMLQKLGDSQL